MVKLTGSEVCQQLGISRKLLQKLSHRDGIGRLVQAPVPYYVYGQKDLEALAQRNRQPGRPVAGKVKPKRKRQAQKPAPIQPAPDAPAQ